MAGTGTYSTLLRNAQLNSLAASLANGVIEVYSGTQAAVNTADPGVAACLIFTKDGGAWVQGEATNGVNLGTAADGAIAGDGNSYEGLGLAAATATWFRFYNNTKTMWIQGAVATSGAALTVTTTAITEDGPVAVTSINIHY